jgi:hypothetical protein
MAYNNRNFSYQGGSAPYRNAAPYNPNYGFQRGGYQPQQVYNAPRKHTGCSKKIMPDGAVILSGWKKSKSGYVKMYARPYSKSKVRTSKTGKEWMNVFVTLTNVSTMQVTKTSGLLDMSNHKLYISELNLVANPSAPNGGYFGKHISKRR